ncbi:hypothetical protein T440DRAFT_398769 [Plenodomus tracheiphilus IPT5]|uniref:Rhodopsin domain-containing protein n=1 Tax=Plenodomus tracheiphilus IPT5 TaxID=1408161 RepID=A0A6A7B269_9PLEO|nr:hypothetical protein T440DRAFT_398769 [Plenodomus tracheiphilus IPT5]
MTRKLIRPVDGGISLIVVSSILIPLTLFPVALRLWSRHILRRHMEINDYLSIAGSTLAIANAILTIVAVLHGGIGYQQIDVTSVYPTFVKLIQASAILYAITSTIIKLSILHLYLVIFPLSSGIKYMAYTIMGITVCYCAGSVVAESLHCNPVTSHDLDKVEAVCTQQESLYFASIILNTVIDFIIFAMPMPVLWGLRVDRAKRISLVVIFGLGFFICIISALRIAAIERLDYKNFSHSVVSVTLYSVLEPCLGAMNACLPLLQPAVNRMASYKVFAVSMEGIPETPKTEELTCVESGQAEHKVEGFGQLDENLSGFVVVGR